MDNVWNSVLLNAAQRPEHTAILDIRNEPATAVSYTALECAVVALADDMSRRKYKTIALYATNSVEWIVVDLACRLADIVLLPLPRFFSPGQIRHALKTVAVDAVLTDQRLQFTAISQAFKPAELLCVGLDVLHSGNGSQDYATSCADVIARPVLLDSADKGLPPFTQKITFTSGSTGVPKGVCLSAEHQARTAHALSNATATLAVKKHLCILPLSTLLENIAGVYVPLLQGACIIVASDQQLGFNGADGFSLSHLLSTISMVQPDSMILMPQLLQALVAAADAGWKAPGCLKFIAVGGGSVHRVLLDKAWQQGLPVYEGYGLSECGSVVALNTPAHRHNGSLGKPLPHVRTRIIEGELQVADAVFLGYAGEPDSWTTVKQDAWVHTGDLCAEDVDGFLHFQGRRKNLIVSSYGRNISPEWVEREISHSPLIAQVIVTGDSRPFCVALIGVSRPSVSNEAIQQAVDDANRMLPGYAQVRRWLRLKNPIGPGKGGIDDLMTTNGRPRRDRIELHYQVQINALYTGSEDIPYVG